MLHADRVFVGVAPINWTNDDMPELGGEISIDQCLDEMQEAGYSGCEVGVKFPRDPEELLPMLRQRSLRVCNQWANYRLSTTTVDEVEKDFRKLTTFLRAVGADVVGGGEVGTSIQGREDKALYRDKPNNTAKQWKDLCSGLDHLGKLAQEEFGLILCFHHHMGTCVQTIEEIERLLNDTNPDYVSMNYDCGHIFASEEDPHAALRKFISRVNHVHLKDVRTEIMREVQAENLSFLEGVRRGMFTILGDGGIDDPAGIFRILDEHDYEGWLVVEAEQDPRKANPFAYAKRARAYLREHTGL